MQQLGTWWALFLLRIHGQLGSDPKVRLAQVHPESRKSTELKHVQSSLKSSSEKCEIHRIHFEHLYTFISFMKHMKHFNAKTYCIHLYLNVVNQHGVHSVKKYLNFGRSNI